MAQKKGPVKKKKKPAEPLRAQVGKDGKAHPHPEYFKKSQAGRGHVWDKDYVYSKFIASEDLTVADWCAKNDLKYEDAQKSFPVDLWNADKRRILGTKAAEAVGEAAFKFNQRFHKDVLDSLLKYPKEIDRWTDILAYTGSEIVKMIQADQQNRDKPGYKRLYDPLKDAKSIACLAEAISKLQKAKYSALLLNEFSVVRTAEDFASADRHAPAKEQEAIDMTKGIAYEVIGSEKLTSEDIKALFDEYIDNGRTHGQFEGHDEAPVPENPEPMVTEEPVY